LLVAPVGQEVLGRWDQWPRLVDIESGRRSIAAAVLGFRVAYGLALVVAPGKVAATVALRGLGSRDGLPDGSSTATAAVAGGSAVLTAVVAAALDE
jgi:hypothetical protein